MTRRPSPLACALRTFIASRRALGVLAGLGTAWLAGCGGSGEQVQRAFALSLVAEERCFAAAQELAEAWARLAGNPEVGRETDERGNLIEPFPALAASRVADALAEGRALLELAGEARERAGSTEAAALAELAEPLGALCAPPEGQLLREYQRSVFEARLEIARDRRQLEKDLNLRAADLAAWKDRLESDFAEASRRAAEHQRDALARREAEAEARRQSLVEADRSQRQRQEEEEAYRRELAASREAEEARHAATARNDEPLPQLQMAPPPPPQSMVDPALVAWAERFPPAVQPVIAVFGSYRKARADRGPQQLTAVCQRLAQDVAQLRSRDDLVPPDAVAANHERRALSELGQASRACLDGEFAKADTLLNRAEERLHLLEERIRGLLPPA